MSQDKVKRYRLRALIGFALLDIAAYASEEQGRAGFERYKAMFTKEKRANPYMLFLVDWEQELTIAEYTELPKGFEDFPLTKYKA